MAHRLGASEDFFAALVQVQRLAARLVGVERRVHVHLDRVALGVLEVHGPGIAMVYLVDVLDAIGLGKGVVALEVIQRVEQE
ncbi:hypothetical protein D3C80_1885020 [compost metagenome]